MGAHERDWLWRGVLLLLPIALWTLSVAVPRIAMAQDAGVLPLPTIPPLQPIEHPPPTPQALSSLDGRIAQLHATRVSGPLDTKTDLRFLTADLGPDLIAAIAQRVEDLRHRLNGPAAERILEKARKAGRKALGRQRSGKDRKRGTGEEDEDKDEGDWLRFVLALERPDDDDWRDVVQLYGLLRMLEASAATPAVRLLIASYGHFGELVRIDLGRAMRRLGDKAVPALIEARQHDARKIQRWAARQLDALGKAIPGEAVSTTDPVILADVLRALGRTRDVDATQVLLSFCGSDRTELRQAAREAIGAVGEPAAWQLKEAYLSLAGKKAPSSWSWEQTARELFRLHDLARLTVAYELMAQGTQAFAERRYRDAAGAFDKALAQVPLFERRGEMVPVYLKHAEELAAESKRDESMMALRKALHLSPPGSNTARIESRLAFLEGQALAERGTPDRFLLRRAIELDPSNVQARELLSSLETVSVVRQSRLQRYVAAMAVGILALVAIVILARKRQPQPSS